MCEYCENDGYYKRNKSLISKTLKNNVDIDLAINVKDKKLVASIENLTMNVEDNNWFLPTKKINYCPMCRKEAGRVKRYASGYWYQFIIPRRLTLPPVRIYRWLNFFWRLKDKEESYE